MSYTSIIFIIISRVRRDTIGYFKSNRVTISRYSTKNIQLDIGDAIIKTFDINITQSDHQKLTVVIGSKEYTESVHNIPYGTNYTVKLESTDDKYVEGEIKIEEK